MNSAEYEIYDAIRAVQKEPVSIRYICLICRGYISDWDARKGYAICWRCRRALYPARKVEFDPSRKRRHWENSRTPYRPSSFPKKDWAGEGYNQFVTGYMGHGYFTKPFVKETLVYTVIYRGNY